MNMSEKPNFLIIMSDQHAPDTIGAMAPSDWQIMTTTPSTTT